MAGPELVEHTVETMLMQRICGIALGYEDLVDHDELRHDPVLATLAGKLEARRRDCAPLAGKSTLNRLEHAPLRPDDRYHKIGHDPAAIEDLFVELLLEAHRTPPQEPLEPDRKPVSVRVMLLDLGNRINARASALGLYSSSGPS